MNVKFFELRDKSTFIPIFAFKTVGGTDQESWLFRRSGFGPSSDLVVLGRLECSGVERNCTYDPYAWGGRTFPSAHQYIEEHFDELHSGSVIDVEYILGETESPKLPEALE